MEIIENTVGDHLLAQALRAADKHRPYLVPMIMGELLLCCGLILNELAARDATLQRRPKVIDFPKPKKKLYRAHLVEAGRPEHVSTLELRRHAFAAYAMAMAHQGAEEAFSAAVYETLRRQPGWTETAAAGHTKRFIVPAYEAAFARVGQPGG